MLFLSLLEISLFLLLVGFLVTQLILPLMQGRPMFPLLRKRTKELDAQMANTRQEIAEKRLEVMIARFNLQKQKLEQEIADLQKAKEGKNEKR